MTQHFIALKDITKSYGDDTVAIHPTTLEIQDGEFLTLVGPSGCGKTTLLRILAGFETADSGTILLNGHNITHQPPEKRPINMVFQSYALFPHMTVFENVAFGLRCQHCPEGELQERISEILKMVNLDDLQDRKPRQLSGGQQQRVAIARAIVTEPQVLLLDEPLSALDYKLRKRMQLELKQIQRRLNITFILVTHDQEEALSMSNRIAVMHNGRIEQLGSPRDVYEEPCNLRVANFIGETNIFETSVLKANENIIEVNIENKNFQLKNTNHFYQNQPILIILRPEDIEVWGKNEVEDTTEMLPGIVHDVIYKGSTVDLKLSLGNGQQIAATEFFDEDDEHLEYEIGEKIWIRWKPGWEVILPNDSE